jgi:membrane fusion protein (multidrug efflux system)
MRRTLLSILIVLCLLSILHAQEGKPPGIPPANVVVAPVSSGTIAPEAEFVGTVFYKEVSEVAAEVSGRVETVSFEEGQRVKRGAQLVKMSADLLEKSLASLQASYEQVLTELEKAQLDLKRAQKLYQEQSVAEQFYDDARFAVKTLEKKAQSLKADVERTKTELEKKTIKAPFDGVVIEKTTEVGEWLAPGTAVATIASEDTLDIVVDVPGSIVPFIKPGMSTTARVNGAEVQGTIITIISRGNVATRTFPVKMRVKNNGSLIEGLEAKVMLPTGEKQKCLIVSRDAVISAFGQTVVFTVENNTAKMHAIDVIGYEGLNAGVRAADLREGMQAIVKGNERVREGQPVQMVKGTE